MEILNSYFLNYFQGQSSENVNIDIEERRHRGQIFGLCAVTYRGLFFSAGDILRSVFERGPVSFFFEGLCLSVRGRKFGRKQTSFIMRNVIVSIGVEFNLAYYLLRLYKLTFSDFKRKKFLYGKPKLFYLRFRLNRESRVR